ncbi:MAG: ATP-dependent DNA helicase RecG [Bacteroidales bacterium]|nr:ATP-dependent DNA helicase RecG [Bacteroidales bacterium]
MDNLKSDIQFLTGVGPKRAEILRKEANISVFEDLLYYFPYRHSDRSKFYEIREISPDLPYIQLKGKFISFEKAGGGRHTRLTGLFNDGTGLVEIVWFKNLKWIASTYNTEKEYVLFGKPVKFGNKVNIVHPEIDEFGVWQKKLTAGLQPHYSTSENMKKNYLNSKAIEKLIQNAFIQIGTSVKETLPSWIINKYKLLPINKALKAMHFPQNTDELANAQYRFKFEELFYLQLKIVRVKNWRYQKIRGYKFNRANDNIVIKCFKQLPFTLTGAQTRVLQEIRSHFESGNQMNLLLQGDVGSGKTLVALLSMLIAIDNGYQACLMVPTEILAKQHFTSISKLLYDLPVNIGLLTGSTKKSVRNEILKLLSGGSLNLLIGTHALIEDTVRFRNLGYVVIDEQHRFGVAQRAKLWEKGETVPHIMVMTATPIPRTLAMTVYGDLDVAVIDELPPGRKPIKTVHATDSQRLGVYGFIEKQIKLGRQIYVVYPLIEESEALDYKALSDGVEGITKAFPPPKYVTAVVHGRLKNDDKEYSMRLFVVGKAHILIATTVIEVGVDVPNAGVMIIESAERFGLSQLHQLRGRVGRGGDQSFCVLMTPNEIGETAMKRISTMVETNDGFTISEVDMQLRGPGDLEGLKQSGFDIGLKVASISKDSQLMQYVRNIAEDIIKEDIYLQLPKNQILLHRLNDLKDDFGDWGRIS